MANGQENHPEPLERHNNEEGGNSDEENESTSDQDELEVEVELDDVTQKEYAALEQTIDQLDSCLDQLDQKNDDLNAKLRALLAVSRQDYEELSAGSKQGGDQDQSRNLPENHNPLGC